MTLEEKRIRKRKYMKKYNSTEKGKLYNRKHAKEWRKRTKSPHGRRTKTRSASYREAIIYYLINKDGLNCGFCNQPIDINTCQIDHIKPFMLGGMCRLENFRLAHKDCNESQGPKIRKEIYGY